MPTSIDDFLINSQQSVSAQKIIFTVVETKFANLKSPFLSLLSTSVSSPSPSIFHLNSTLHSQANILVATKETYMNFYKGLCNTKDKKML